MNICVIPLKIILNDVNNKVFNCFTLFVANIIKCKHVQIYDKKHKIIVLKAMINSLKYTKAWSYLSAVYISGKVSRMSNMVVFVCLSGKTVIICLHLFESSFTVNISR